MDHGLPEDRRDNGGFPDPPASVAVRVVAARHERCGSRTRVRLPAVVPIEAVRRVRCSGCQAAYPIESASELETEGAKRTLRPPSLRVWQWVSVPVGAAAVIAALLLIQGGGTTPPGGENAASGPGSQDRAGAARDGAGAQGGATAQGEGAASGARLVRGSRFALALPPGWERVRAQGGASFAAEAPEGDADATLWIEHAPELDLASFEARSLAQLRSLAGSASVTDRVAAPTPEGTITRLAADAPPGEPRLEVTLRAAGPYRYYLATTLQPDASARGVDGVELIHGSFIPELDGNG